MNSRFSCLAVVASFLVAISCGDNVHAPDAAPSDGPPVVPATLAIDVTSFPFGSVTVGEPSPAATFIISNTGDQASGVPAAVLQGPDAASFQIASDACTAPLAPAASCAITVTFTPSSPDARTASLVVAASPGGSVMASLDGTGVTPGALTISASTNALGSVVVGQTGTTVATFTVTNTGGAASGALVLQASGADPADFVKQADLCAGVVLAPAATCTFDVAFAPLSVGAKSAAFDVSGNPGGLVSGAVSGLGLAPARLVTAFLHQDFGSIVVGETGAAVTLVFENLGDVATSALTQTFSGAGASFPATGTCLGATVAAGATCTLILQFAPTTVGTHTAQVTVAGAPQGGEVVVTLEGRGIAAAQLTIAPATHLYPNTLVTQTSAAQVFTITNTGAAPSGALLTSLAGSDPSQFPIVTDGCNGGSLAASATCTITVVFAPTSEGPSTAQLGVASATGGTVSAGLSGLGLAPARLGIAPASKDFGTAATTSPSTAQSFTVTNLGGQLSGIPTAALGGLQPAQFTITGTSCTAALAPGATCSVQVRFEATALGVAAATLDVTATPGGAASATLAGEGVAPGQLAIVPSTFAFPTTAIGDSRTQPFTVRNTGTATTGAITVSITGDYTTTSDCTTLVAQATCTITVTFSPTVTGPRLTSLSASASPGGTATAGLSGIGQPRLEIVALDGGPVVDPFDFGAAIITNVTPHDGFITVRNNTATIGAFTIATAYGTPDQYATIGDTCGGSIDASGGLCTVRVRFQPTTTGVKPGSVTFSIGAGAANQATQNLTGTGIDSLIITPLDGTSFGSVPRNTTSTPYGFRISNPAGSTTTGAITATLTGAAFQIAANDCTQPLVGGGSCLVSLTFSPTTVGVDSAVLTTSATPGGSPSVTVTGTGVDPVGAIPTDIALSPSSVPENSPIGTGVGTFFTTDTDATDTFTYSLIPGGADNGAFSIAGSQLLTNSAFDFETKSSYAIRVRSTDSGGQIFDEDLTVTVTNVDEPPVAVTDDVLVVEDSAATALAVLVNDTDVDGGPKTVASVTAPANGTAVIIGGGTDVTYQPTADYTGPDSFTYTLNGGSIATVNVTVTAVDDAPLAITDSATVAEDAPATAIDVLANDTDVDGGALTIISVVQPANGTVVLAPGGLGLTYQPNPDHNGVDSFTYTLNGGSPAAVMVIITPVDDLPVAAADSAAMPEDAPATAIDVLANDVDVDGDAITITAITQPANGVAANAGTSLTYQPNANFTGVDTLTYTINGGSTATVTITVTDVDDSPVAVDDAATVVEDAAATAVPVLTNDTDPDGGPRVIAAASDPTRGTVVLTGGTPGAHTGLTYQPDPNSCNSPPATTLDTFTYTLNGGATATVAMTVTCVNDAPTELALSSATLAESAVVDIGTFTTTDVDTGDTFTHTLVAGAGSTDNAAFTITGGNTLRNLAAFDFEAAHGPTYSIRVRTTDLGGLTFEEVFTITVTDANDAPTALTLSNATLAESVGPTNIGTFTTTDPDAGDTATYTLVPGTGSTDNAAFTITGTALRNVAAFDFEAAHGPTYAIRVRTTDAAGLTFEAAFTITVTNANEAPTAIALSSATVAENAVAPSIGTFTTTDLDAGDTATYTLVAGTGSTDNAAFAITGATLRNVTAFNFETAPTRSIRVRTTDGSGLFFEAAFTITVTNVNEAPTALAVSNATLAENVAASNIGTFTTTDPDAGDTFTMTLVAGAGSTDNAAFAMVGATLRNVAAFDFEAAHGPTYAIRVRTTDGGSLTFEQTFTITVTNADEAPTAIALSSATIIENVGASNIGTFTTTDPDAGDTATHTLVAGLGDTDNAAFAIVTGTTLRNVAAFDFEAAHGPTYSIRVRTTDGSAATFEQVFTITVTNANESPTDIALTSATIAENVGASNIGTFTTTDGDAGSTATHTLVAGAGDTDNAAFTIAGGNTLRNVAAFDFEAAHGPTYSIRVRTTDNTSLTFEEVFTITVTNANEAPTAIALSSATIVENVGASNIGAFTTTDADAGDTATHTLVTGAGDTDNAAFAIATGTTLRNVAAFDFEAAHGPTYSIRVRTTDGSAATFEQVFTITVTNANESPTDIALTSATIAENVGASNIGTFTTTDGDAGSTATHTLVAGAGATDNAAFTIAGGNTLRNVAAFDFEAAHGPTYSIRVRTTDDTSLTFEEVFTITVTNVNEAPVADAETFDTFGNTELRVGLTAPATPTVVVAGDVLTGDADPDGEAIAIVGISGCADATFPLDCAVAGGTVSLNATGTFSFVPAPTLPSGAPTLTTFQYVIQDAGGLTASGLVTVQVFDKIWYVKGGAAAGTGTSAAPLSSFGGIAGAGGSGDADGTGDYIFVHDSMVAGGLELEASQRLIGEGVGLVLPRTLNPAGAGTTTLVAPGLKPNIFNATAEAVRITAAMPVEVRGLTLGGGTNAIDLTAAGAYSGSPTLTLADLAFNGAGGAAGADDSDVDINAGATGTLGLTIQNTTWDTTNPHAGNGLDVVATSGTLNVNLASNTGIRTVLDGIVVNAIAPSAITITGFANTAISGDTGGSGVVMTRVKFDAIPGGATDQVGGGTLRVGSPGNPVGGNGLLLLNTQGGSVVFDDLDLDAAAEGLEADSFSMAVASRFTLAVAPAPPAGSGTSRIASGTGAAVRTSAMVIDLRLVAIFSTDSLGSGVSLSDTTGRFSAGGAIVNAAAADFAIGQGTVDVAYSGTITDDIGSLITISSTTGGDKVFTGAITDGDNGSGFGILLASNTAGTVRFAGGLILSTGPSRAFIAQGGGTLEICDENPCNPAATGPLVNKLTTTAGTALTVSGVTIGANNLELRSLAANGAPSGIILTNTGTLGGLRVTGTGTSGTGGTIQNSTNSGVTLTTTTNLRLSHMTITNSAEDGIEGTNVTNLDLTGCIITGSGDDSEDVGIGIDNLLGSATWTNVAVTGSELANVMIHNDTGTLSGFTIQGGDYSSLGTAFGGNSILVELTGTAALTSGLIDGATILNNRPARGITVQAQGTSSIGNATDAFVVQNTTFTNNGLHASFEQSGSANLTFELLTNGTAVTPMTMPNVAGTSHAVNVASSAVSTGGTLRGRIIGNFIGNAGIAGSGSAFGNGVRVLVQGKTQATLMIDSNVIRQVPQGRGIDAQFLGTVDGSAAPTSDLTITNNTVTPQDATGFPLAAIYLAADSQSAGALTMRSNVTGNTIPAGATFESTGTFLTIEQIAPGVAQLVDTGAASASCTAQLASVNTGSAAAGPGCGLIAGPITTP